MSDLVLPYTFALYLRSDPGAALVANGNSPAATGVSRPFAAVPALHATFHVYCEEASLTCVLYFTKHESWINLA